MEIHWTTHQRSNNTYWNTANNSCYCTQIPLHGTPAGQSITVWQPHRIWLCNYWRHSWSWLGNAILLQQDPQHFTPKSQPLHFEKLMAGLKMPRQTSMYLSGWHLGIYKSLLKNVEQDDKKKKKTIVKSMGSTINPPKCRWAHFWTSTTTDIPALVKSNTHWVSHSQTDRDNFTNINNTNLCKQSTSLEFILLWMATWTKRKQTIPPSSLLSNFITSKAHTVYKQCYLPAIAYPLPATSKKPTANQGTQDTVTTVFLSCMGNFPHSATFAPANLGSLGLCHIGYKQDVQNTLFLIKHIHAQTTNGTILWILLTNNTQEYLHQSWNIHVQHHGAPRLDNLPLAIPPLDQQQNCTTKHMACCTMTTRRSPHHGQHTATVSPQTISIRHQQCLSLPLHQHAIRNCWPHRNQAPSWVLQHSPHQHNTNHHIIWINYHLAQPTLPQT